MAGSGFLNFPFEGRGLAGIDHWTLGKDQDEEQDDEDEERGRC